MCKLSFPNLLKSQSTIYYHFRQFHNVGHSWTKLRFNSILVHRCQFGEIVSMFQNIDRGCEMDWVQLDSVFRDALSRPQGAKHSKSMWKSNLFALPRTRRQRILAIISACVSFKRDVNLERRAVPTYIHAGRSSWNARNQFLLGRRLFRQKSTLLWSTTKCQFVIFPRFFRLTFLFPWSFIKLENVSIHINLKSEIVESRGGWRWSGLGKKEDLQKSNPYLDNPE